MGRVENRYFGQMERDRVWNAKQIVPVFGMKMRGLAF